MTNDLDVKSLYEGARDLPAFGDLDQIRRLGRRRRLLIRGGTGVILATGALGLAVVMPNILGGGESARAPIAPAPSVQTPDGNQTPETTPGATPFVDVQPGSAAPAGTVAYRECATSCSLFVTAPGTDPVDVGAQIPALQSAIQGLADTSLVTLSFDSQWIGLPADQGYLVANLRTAGKVVQVPDAPAGQQWEPIGWTSSSGSLALMQRGSAGAAAFAMVNTYDPTGQTASVDVLSENPLPDWVPIANGGDSVEVISPYGNGPLQAIDSQLVFIASDSFKPGETVASNEEPFDLSGCLNSTETIVSGRGAPAVFSPPTSESPQGSQGALINAILVFDTSTGSATGVVGLDCSRYELPESISAISPRSTDSSQGLVQEGDSTQVVLLSGSGASEIVFESAQATEIILPGQTVASLLPAR